MKHYLALIALLFGGALAVACGHSSTQEATADCTELAKSNPAITGETFNKCVACFENCSDCESVASSPITFKCPGDKAAQGGAGGSGTGASTGTGK